MTFDSRRMKLVCRPTARRNFSFYKMQSHPTKRFREFYHNKPYKISNILNGVTKNQNVKIRAITITKNHSLEALKNRLQLQTSLNLKARHASPDSLHSDSDSSVLTCDDVHECAIDSDTLEKLKDSTELELNAIDLLHTRFGNTSRCDFMMQMSEERKQPKKRGNLPKTSVAILKGWLVKNLYKAYPTEEQKRELASETGLTLLQVGNWFINARRRIVPKLIMKDGKEPDKYRITKTGVMKKRIPVSSLS